MTSGRLVCSRRRLDVLHVGDGVKALACMASPDTRSERSMVGIGRVQRCDLDACSAVIWDGALLSRAIALLLTIELVPGVARDQFDSEQESD